MAKFMYDKNGAKLFKDGEEVPAGYVDCPTKVEDKPKAKKLTKKKDNVAKIKKGK